MSHVANVTQTTLPLPAPKLAVGTRVTHPKLGGGVVVSNADSRGRPGHQCVRWYKTGTLLEGPAAELAADMRRLSIIDGGRADETRFEAYLRKAGGAR
jgi:hypothetical protein